jgi:tetratricopeptide (TPR) repeat protein
VIHAEPANSPQREQLGWLYHDLALHLRGARGHAAALSAYQRCAEIWEAMIPINALSDRRKDSLAIVHCRIGACHEVLGDGAAAAIAYQRCIELVESAKASRKTTRKLTTILAESHRQLGNLMESSGELAEAIRHHQEAARILKRQLASNPYNATARKCLASSEAKIQELEIALGRSTPES